MAGDWYSTGGALIQNSLITDFVVINVIVDFLRPDVFLFRRVLARRARACARVRTGVGVGVRVTVRPTSFSSGPLFLFRPTCTQQQMNKVGQP